MDVLVEPFAGGGSILLNASSDAKSNSIEDRNLVEAGVASATLSAYRSALDPFDAWRKE